MTTGEFDQLHDADEAVALVRRGLQVVEKLIAERDALRARVAMLEGSASSVAGASAHEELVALHQKVAQLSEERRVARERQAKAEDLVHGMKARVDELEDESNHLANLYIASHQLYGAMRFRDVVLVVSEIVINLIGVQRFALFMLDPPTQTLHALLTEGHSELPAPVPVGEGPIGRAASARQRYVADGNTMPLVVLPLLSNGSLLGALAIDELLPHKPGLSAVDQELFTLLCDHAGPALRAAILKERSAVDSDDTPWTVEDLRESMAR